MSLGDFIQGAAGGGMGGFAVGGPLGGAIGAGLGGLVTLFGGGGSRDKYQSQLQGLADTYGGRDPYQAAQAGESSFRGNQQSLVDQLTAMGNGTAPSLAEAQLRSATDRNVRQAQALSAGSGPNAALAQFRAQNAQAGMGAQAAQDAASARIAEQQAALNQLGLVLQGARGQDQSLGQFNAEQLNQAQQFQRGLNDSSQLAALGMLGDQVSQPTLGERLLAAGGGALGQFAANRMAGRSGTNAAFRPGAGGVLPMGAFGGPGPQQQQPDPYAQWWNQHG